MLPVQFSRRHQQWAPKEGFHPPVQSLETQLFQGASTDSTSQKYPRWKLVVLNHHYKC